MVATWLSVAILFLKFIGLICLLAKRWRNRGEVGGAGGEARAPETVTGMLWLLCGSHVLGDFRGMGQLEPRERDEIVKGRGKKFELGNLVGVDKAERWGVDGGIFVW